MSLAARNLCFKHILHHVDAECAPGRITIVLGPNGAGKTTLLRCLAGLQLPDEGAALLNTTPVGQIQTLGHGR
jgi:ABC-type multidrug transport system ATPase subunit